MLNLSKYLPLGIVLALLQPLSAKVDFNRDIRPILSDKCFHCHGPDAKNQKSSFRVDTRENALKDLGGYAGVVPGDLMKSELSVRIHLDKDDDDLMPPLDSNRTLSDREKDLLDQWIREGAEYDQHWAFKKPVKAEFPKLEPETEKWVRNPIDRYVAGQLAEAGLKPSTEADTSILVRRAALTLTGLLPSQDVAGMSYEDAVEALLGSMDYAERQALRWLDAARYADTDGYQTDAERKNWPWRDWVIKAYHENMPFDQFTIEQLAGDMLPDATTHQILASTFNRNHRQNAEGGALAPEFYVENVIDRLETTSTVWLGLTMGCARCHDHKYDPLTQREFYQLFGYFNNIGERGTGKGVTANPVMQIQSPLAVVPESLKQELADAKAAEVEVKKDFPNRLKEWAEKMAKASPTDTPVWTTESTGTAKVESAKGTLSRQEDGSWLIDKGNFSKIDYRITIPGEIDEQVIAGIQLDALPHESFTNPRKLSRSVNGNFVLSEFEVHHNGNPVMITAASATFEQDKYPVKNTIDGNLSTGWAIYGQNPTQDPASATFALAEPIVLKEGDKLEVLMKHHSSFANHNIGRFQLHFSSTTPKLNEKSTLSPKVLAVLQLPEKQRSAAQHKILADYFLTIDPAQTRAQKKREAIEKKIANSGAGAVAVMVMKEKTGARTPAYLLDRGQYDAPDKSEELPRKLPAALFSGADDEQPKDRLELATWIVSKNNPLTARVIVNRIWQEHFGVGLVKTAEDFGVQGEVPVHAKLLDWLAVEFMESGWDVKGLHRLIVTSATYRQNSAVSKELIEKDPENRLMARGPRFRLDGFAIRDNALKASGLLNEHVGGPPVKPYQPEGLWNAVSSGAGTRYSPDKGDDLYRKSMYTYWKRAVNPPRQLIFDAGGREACNVAVKRTNTPLQALVLMNDVTFVEAARNLAEKVLKDKSSNLPEKRIVQIFRLATGSDPSKAAQAVLLENLEWFQQHYAADPAQAENYLKAGDSPRDASIPAVDHAAWTAVAHLVLNLDQTLTVQ
jgi:hypothetical protein